jgi:hypothetical protein
MSITNSNGRSPWSRQIDRELDRAVADQVISANAAESLKARLAKTTTEWRNTTMENLTGSNIISSASRKEVCARRGAREKEITRLGTLLAAARGSRRKNEFTSELLAFLGFIHNTPDARIRWENQ